jgi:hypothetical protein
MDLTKQHRECFIDELEKAIEDLDLQKKCLLKCKEDDFASKRRWEIRIFLAEQRINLIKESLINNEIDF